MNRITLIGNIGKDPEVKQLEGGMSIAKFSVATTENWKDKNGDKKSDTTWHNIVAWGKQAEVVEKWFKKGMKIYVEGQQQHRKVESGDDTKYYSEVKMSGFEFVGSQENSTKEVTPKNTEEEDDLPF